MISDLDFLGRPTPKSRGVGSGERGTSPLRIGAEPVLVLPSGPTSKSMIEPKGAERGGCFLVLRRHRVR